MSTKLKADETVYSDEIKGDAGNYHWAATFDKNGAGYLGINQKGERVLLSPGQVKALLAFLGRGSP